MAVFEGVRPIAGLRSPGHAGQPGSRHAAEGRHWAALPDALRRPRPTSGARSMAGAHAMTRARPAADRPRHQPYAGASLLAPERVFDRGIDRSQRMAIPRRRQTAHSRAGRRQGRIGLALAGILVAFLLALFYLTQTVHVAATNYDIGSLLADRDRMNQQLQSLQGDIARLGAEHAVSGRAQELDLDPLGAAVWVAPR